MEGKSGAKQGEGDAGGRGGDPRREVQTFARGMMQKKRRLARSVTGASTSRLRFNWALVLLDTGVDLGGRLLGLVQLLNELLVVQEARCVLGRRGQGSEKVSS